jgi:hypothetical protein
LSVSITITRAVNIYVCPCMMMPAGVEGVREKKRERERKEREREGETTVCLAIV